ncbi:MAG: spore coat associated protein CotJA [Anaerostipes sp.]|nr:spore coat associated protein CotJA [Anaerostipes sp.]MBS7009589.1 spore coat associated protein CotJA [Anaerostipes sp.]
MRQKDHISRRRDGVDSMPLAMAYVPWQHWDQVYCPEEGLACGTIFPELNKPFYGKAGCRR